MKQAPASDEDVQAAEEKRVARLSDDEALKLSGHGRYGPGIIGKALHGRVSKILKATGDGRFGPAITDPDFATKQAAARGVAEEPEPATNDVPTGPIDPADLKDPRNPWTYVTLSGAKLLAQEHGVSHSPRIKRAELIADLQHAGVTPPPVPDDTDEDEPE